MTNKLLQEVIDEKSAILGFIDSLKKSAGYAHALGHYQANPQWLSIRDLLENVVEQGQKMYFAKAMPRAEVLQALEVRKNQIN